jgi:hypothetical protein
MAVDPPSNLAPVSVTVAGAVAVTNFPAIQPVSGTVTALQGTTPWVVDGSAVTQPVSVASLPLPTGAADNETLSEIALMAILQRERMEVE